MKGFLACLFHIFFSFGNVFMLLIMHYGWYNFKGLFRSFCMSMYKLEVNFLLFLKLKLKPPLWFKCTSSHAFLHALLHPKIINFFDVSSSVVHSNIMGVWGTIEKDVFWGCEKAPHYGIGYSQLLLFAFPLPLPYQKGDRIAEIRMKDSKGRISKGLMNIHCC